MARNSGIGFFFVLYVTLLTGMSLRAWWDFTHPRPWGIPGNDPHVYVWAVAVVWVVFLYIFVRICQMERQASRRARIAWLLQRTQALLREGRTEEAEACLNECKAMTGYDKATACLANTNKKENRMGLFNDFMSGFMTGAVNGLRQNQSPQGSAWIDRFCQELGWAVDERVGTDGVLLHFNCPITRIRKLLITPGDSGKVAVFSAFSAARVPVRQMPADLLAYVLDRNRQMPLPAWGIDIAEGRVTFSAAYFALIHGLDAPLFKYICEGTIREVNAFDARMQAAGLL